MTSLPLGKDGVQNKTWKRQRPDWCCFVFFQVFLSGQDQRTAAGLGSRRQHGGGLRTRPSWRHRGDGERLQVHHEAADGWQRLSAGKVAQFCLSCCHFLSDSSSALNLFRKISQWPPSCWRNFTRKPKPTEAGCCAGSTASAAMVTSAAWGRGLWSGSDQFWRPYRYSVTLIIFRRMRSVWVKLHVSFFPCAEELEADCQSATSKVFRRQKILQGTSFHILASAVGRSPSVLGTLGAEKIERVVRLAGVAFPSENPKVI